MDSTATCKACVHPYSADNVVEQRYGQRRPPVVYQNHFNLDQTRCTDRCIVVACDKEHVAEGVNEEELHRNCGGEECDTPCQPSLVPVNHWQCDASGCSFEEMFQCCVNDISPSCPPQCIQEYPQEWNWDPNAMNNVICNDYDCNTTHNSTPFQQPTIPYTLPHANNWHAMPSLSAGPQDNMACMWGDCTEPFHDLDALIAHVQNAHFQAPSMDVQQSQMTNYVDSSEALAYNMSSQQFLQDYHHETSSNKTLPCQWGNCGTHLNLPVPTDHQQCSDCYNPSGDLSKLDTAALIQHLISRHIKSQESSRDTSLDSPVDVSGSSHASTSSSVSMVSPSMEHDVTQTSPTSGCICKWESCNQAFISEDELTAHIAEVHVGHGRSVYECHWEGCDRHGDNAFPSKQKVMRHIQKHSGYKPHMCNVCNERFAEATSLQQHMRRHTQERPYVCDFPGCGKSFAIPGGLRIHKRAHSGEKPFKCPEAGCGKAFAESSNLAKHMRIHTGVKPFHCTHPGCGRSFGRKDQLLRHATMHTAESGSA